MGKGEGRVGSGWDVVRLKEGVLGLGNIVVYFNYKKWFRGRFGGARVMFVRFI